MEEEYICDIGTACSIQKVGEDIHIAFYNGDVCKYRGIVEGKDVLFISQWIIGNFSNESAHGGVYDERYNGR
ncbi:hypothetical protein [Bacillus gaemokensis]|uniref:Uncharacterized protein n=1 Tax=Bacillus gaemokensis TaxID=574375 RepID=A0A073K7K6_9BACI|nr:hypothetical protein [Bacillus gaemokensis]KEK22516.1 hypothetical protein BAGA_19160 [Bacillus gaemokensis]KYG28786.1 hypothetical protein AZF08_13760 [Bacillus gaemokensis]